MNGTGIIGTYTSSVPFSLLADTYSIGDSMTESSPDLQKNFVIDNEIESSPYFQRNLVDNNKKPPPNLLENPIGD